MTRLARQHTPMVALLAALLAGLASPLGAQHALPTLTDGHPASIVDLRTNEGLSMVGGQWRYQDARLAPVAFNAPGADLKPSGPPVTTLQVEPRPGTPSFDAIAWTTIGATELEARRGPGRTSFAWYRTSITVPERLGRTDTAGATLVFEIVVDDYAEIWVNGALMRALGQTGGTLVAGFNSPNRVVLTNRAQAGQTFDVAVFAVNGPISDAPANFIWVRSATLELFAPRKSSHPVATQITRRDVALDTIVPPDATIEKLAEGFDFTEGPVWMEGALYFSDPNRNTIYRWSEQEGLSTFRVKSGYTGADVGDYGQPGSNGLALDAEGRLVINEHGNRRVTRLEKNGSITVVADRFEGKRLNSPNDLTFRSDGTLYFTDPPFGLPKFHDDPRRELPYTGVYAVRNGDVRLVAKELTGPNGLAFSPDERYLYVSNWDTTRKVVTRYAAHADGSLGPGEVFFDMTSAPGEEALDGLKTDELGNVYVSGPGGLWIISPSGQHLGTIAGPELPANFAWGGDDGRTLYLTARTGLYRIRLNVAGHRTRFTTRMSARE